MSDTLTPWRLIGREHFRRCGLVSAHAWCYRGRYHWKAYRPSPAPSTLPTIEEGVSPTLAAAKHAATAALATLAADGRWNMED